MGKKRVYREGSKKLGHLDTEFSEILPRSLTYMAVKGGGLPVAGVGGGSPAAGVASEEAPGSGE